MKLMSFLTGLMILICISATWSTSATSVAKTNPTSLKSYSMNQLIDLALVNSREFGIADLESKSLAAEFQQASIWENPIINLSSETKREPGGETRQFQIGASQNLDLFGKHSLLGEIANSDFKTAKFLRTQTELTLRHEIVLKTFNYLVAEERSHHAQERFRRFKDIQTYLRSRTFASPQKQAEAMIVTGKLLVLDKQFLELKIEAEAAWEDLNLYLGLIQKPQIHVSWYRKGIEFSPQDLLTKIETNNPQLKHQQILIEKSVQQVQLNRIESWPDLNVGVTFADARGYSPEKTFGLGLSFPIPAFNSNRAGLQASQYREQAERARLEFEKEKLQLHLKTTLSRYEAARTAIQHLPIDGIANIEKQMSKIDHGFRKGQVDLLTYIEADTQHSETLQAIYAAQVEYLSYLSSLQRAIGEQNISAEKN